MIGSMSAPIAWIPAECIRRLSLGGLPQASGNVFRTADQYCTSVACMRVGVAALAIAAVLAERPEGQLEIALDRLDERGVDDDSPAARFV